MANYCYYQVKVVGKNAEFVCRTMPSGDLCTVKVIDENTAVVYGNCRWKLDFGCEMWEGKNPLDVDVEELDPDDYRYYMLRSKSAMFDCEIFALSEYEDFDPESNAGDQPLFEHYDRGDCWGYDPLTYEECLEKAVELFGESECVSWHYTDEDDFDETEEETASAIPLKKETSSQQSASSLENGAESMDSKVDSKEAGKTSVVKQRKELKDKICKIDQMIGKINLELDRKNQSLVNQIKRIDDAEVNLQKVENKISSLQKKIASAKERESVLQQITEEKEVEENKLKIAASRYNKLLSQFEEAEHVLARTWFFKSKPQMEVDRLRPLVDEAKRKYDEQQKVFKKVETKYMSSVNATDVISRSSIQLKKQQEELAKKQMQNNNKLERRAKLEQEKENLEKQQQELREKKSALQRDLKKTVKKKSTASTEKPVKPKQKQATIVKKNSTVSTEKPVKPKQKQTTKRNEAVEEEPEERIVFDAIVGAQLFYADVVFNNDDEVSFDGKHTITTGLQFNVARISQYPIIMQNAKFVGTEIYKLIQYVEANEALMIPKSKMHRELLKATRGYPITGSTIFNFCAWHMLLITADEEKTMYNVVIDQNLLRGIPDAFSFVIEFIRTLRACNGIRGAYDVVFTSAFNADGPCKRIADPVPGAVRESMKQIHVND